MYLSSCTLFNSVMRVACCRTVLDKCGNPQCIIQDGYTALMMAYDSGHMECVKVLLHKGAQVNIHHEVSGVIICNA